MSNNDWVQEGTPRDADWAAEEDDYGVPLEQWDDYSSEQAVPVPTPQPEASSVETAPEPEEAAYEAGAPDVSTDAAETYTGTSVPEPELNPDDVRTEESIQLQPADVYPGVVSTSEPPAETGEAVTFTDATGTEPADEVHDGIDADATDVQADDADVLAAEGYDDAPAADDHTYTDEQVSDEEVGPDVYEEPVIADDLVAEGDPVAVASPEAADTFVDDDVEATHTTIEDGDAGTIPAPVLADADGDTVDPVDPEAVPVWNDDPDADGVSFAETAEEPGIDDEPVHGDESVIDDEHRVDDDSTQTYDAFADGSADDGTRVDSDPEAVVFGRPGAPVADGASSTAPLAAAGGAAAMAGLYRGDGDTSDQTQVIDTATERRTIEQEREEEARLARELQAERDARNSRLGVVATSDANATREPTLVRRGVGPFGSFGLFVLRLVTALIVGVIGYQILTNISDTANYLANQPLIPEPRLVAWILGFTFAVLAVMLVIGLGVRIVGFVLAAIAIAALALIRWGSFSLFAENMEGFRGDHDLLLAAVGILFFSIGGGRFGVDGAISRARAVAREAKRS